MRTKYYKSSRGKQKMLKSIKTSIFATLLALGLSTGAAGAPFLMSQPYAATAVQPESFTVVINGVSKTVDPTKDANNLNVLKFDLDGIGLGDKSATITATNIWGNSGTATYNFSASAPAIPTGFYISKD
ncbi:MAG: hypothetical protein KC589_03120 [Nanoarchaeota archaeon]|nr:hypothetical protein [Nanoarchaeota archaeon]